ncbi:hypothetical protein [Rhodococcus qingshengii]|uniref:hypothetical protein n=1 Tax=Rhodococcus qingshengii TaxID=334542 RepID=UPI0035DC7087
MKEAVHKATHHSLNANLAVTTTAVVSLGINYLARRKKQDKRLSFAACNTIIASLSISPIAALMAEHLHHKKLCSPCAEDLPLNAPEVAARYKKVFRAFHFVTERPIVSTTSIGITGALVTMGLGKKGLDRTVMTFDAVSGSALVLMSALHSRYEAWCPYCDPGDDPESEIEDAPVPALSV